MSVQSMKGMSIGKGNRGVALKEKALRREEALERQRAYEALSTAEKLERAQAAPGKSARQIARLERRLEIEAAAAEKEAVDKERKVEAKKAKTKKA